ncbi:hypothetical protein Tco_1336175 [Tanacetum coccineum]
MKESLSKEVKMTKMVKAKENVLDTEIQITSSENSQSHQEARTKGLLSEEGMPDEWIKDSGCSKHMTGNQKLFSTYKAYNGVPGDGVAGVKQRRRDLYSDGVRNFATASRCGRLKEDLESSTWRRRQDF